MNILVVDDSFTIRKMLTSLLKEKYPTSKIVEASDGKEAFHTLTWNSFDLIITDLEMGEHDGDNFIRKIINNKVLKNKKILIHSSNEEFFKDFNVPLTENMAFISKSESRDNLIKKIEELLSK